MSFLHKEKAKLQEIQDNANQDILNEFDEVFFLPIKKVLNEKPKFEKTTTYSNIIQALKRGDVLYIMSRQGFFVKNGNERLYKELNEIANYNNIERAYKVNFNSLPHDIKSVVSTSINQTQNIEDKVQNILTVGVGVLLAKNIKSSISPNLEKMSKIGSSAIKENLDNVVENDVFKNYYESYADSVEKYIKGFTEEEIEKLRQKVANVRLQGGDVNSLRDVISNGRNLTENRIKLIVRQETALANSSYEKKQYADAGMRFFKWVHPNPTKETSRPHHVDWARQSKQDKVLFDSLNPPRNPSTGEAEMPSEPFNCSCYAVYVKPKENFEP